MFSKILFISSSSSCHEKAKVALYFGRIRNRLGVIQCPFSGFFFNFFQLNLLLVRSHQAEIINHKASYPRTQQRVRWGWELILDHAIVITQSP